MNRWGRYLPLVLAMAAYGCEGDDGRPEYPSFDSDLGQVLGGEGDASQFLALVNMSSYAAALEGGSSLTFIAPNNAAMGGATIPTEPEEIDALVGFHILGGTIDSNLLGLGGEFRTVTGTTVRVVASCPSGPCTNADAGAGRITIEFLDRGGDRVGIVKKDLRAKNGVAHVIDGVLTPPPSEMPPPMPGNLVEELTESGMFAALLTEATATGVATTLAGAGPFTVFAPVDAAFTATDLSMAKDEIVENVLLHHVVSGENDAAALAANPTLTSLAGLELKVEGGGMTVGGATIGELTDIDATNGVAHSVTGLILPPTTVEFISTESSNLQRTSMAQMSAMLMALEPATLTGADPVTFFAPSQDAWADAGIQIGMTATATLTDILEAHTVSGQVTSDQLSNGATFTAVDGRTLTVENDGTRVTLVDAAGNRAEVTATEIRTLSGVVYIVDGILGYTP